MVWRGYLKVNKDGSGDGWIEGLPEKKSRSSIPFRKIVFFTSSKFITHRKQG